LEQYEKIYLYKRIVNAKLYIDSHFACNIDLDNISEQARFSKFHFIRLFKSIYGLTPKNHLIKTRIDNAKKLLLCGHSVLETGLMVGLESPTSFSGMFKKITGLTPSDYQKQEKARQSRIRQEPLQFVPNCFAKTHGWTK
jgi:AraC-like DNA-binding protein